MKFQIERISLFSDAVFAIAITLMMIEIKAPHLEHHISFGKAAVTLLKMFPIFAGTILSFFLIGMFWIRHHKLMKYMNGYTGKVLWLNISFLLCIAFLPFSTSLVFENFQAESPVPLLVYNLNYMFATWFEYRLFAYVLNPANGICTEDAVSENYHYKSELLYPLVVYILVAALAFVNPALAPIGYAAFSLKEFVLRRKKEAVQAPFNAE